MILRIHSLILNKIDDDNAGRLRRMPVRVIGSSTVFPNYMRVPAMLDELVEDIRTAKMHACLKAARRICSLSASTPLSMAMAGQPGY